MPRDGTGQSCFERGALEPGDECVGTVKAAY